MRKVLGCLFLMAAPVIGQPVNDPTRPPQLMAEDMAVTTSNTSGAVALNAIMQVGKTSIAIINGTAMQVGDEAAGIKLKQVNSDSVVVDVMLGSSMQERTLRLHSAGEIKKNAADNF